LLNFIYYNKKKKKKKMLLSFTSKKTQKSLFASCEFSTTSLLNVRKSLTKEEKDIIDEVSEEVYNNSPSFPEPVVPTSTPSSARLAENSYGKIVTAQDEEGRRRAVIIKEDSTKKATEIAQSELPTDVDRATIEARVKKNMDQLFTATDEYLGGATVMRNQEESYGKSIDEVGVAYANEGSDNQDSARNSPNPSEMSMDSEQAKAIALASFKDSPTNSDGAVSESVQDDSNSDSGFSGSGSSEANPSSNSNSALPSSPAAPASSEEDIYGASPGSPALPASPASSEEDIYGASPQAPSNLEQSNDLTESTNSTEGKISSSHKRNHSDYEFESNKRPNINNNNNINDDDDNNNRKGPGSTGPSGPSGDGSSGEGGSSSGTSNKMISDDFLSNFLYGKYHGGGGENFVSPIDYIIELEQEELLEMPSIFDGFDLL